MKTEIVIDKLKVLIENNVRKKKYDVALNAAETLAGIYYDYNQLYMDAWLEEILLVIQKAILETKKFTPNTDHVFFYDGFGLDIRGWAVSYIKALISQGFKVVYACPKKSFSKIPHIISELNKGESKIIYLDDTISKTKRIKDINLIFQKYKPNAAFFYTLPDDVCGSIAFSNNPSSLRFQVDLTDHAYWIGVNAFDYIFECREMGASLALFHRGVKSSQILKIDCAPYISNDECAIPLPFDIKNEKYIFSGGALYKTLGDPELLYYKTVDTILDKHKDVKFLYAGNGNDSELNKLINKYKGRVFLINERSDFFKIMENSVLYLNTYPMFGGLMMRYAALASKVPITLKHNDDSNGILINQEKLGIEFDDYHEYISEIHHLLYDESYRRKKELLVSQSVITETQFAKNISLAIKEQKTEYCFNKIPNYNTVDFRREYKSRYKKANLYKRIATRNNYKFAYCFPFEYIYGYILKLKGRM